MYWFKYWGHQVEEVYGGRDLLNPRSGKLDPETGKEEIPRQILEQAGEMGLTGVAMKQFEEARYRKARGHGQFSENPRFKKFDPDILINDKQITLADVLEDRKKTIEHLCEFPYVEYASKRKGNFILMINPNTELFDQRNFCKV